MKVNAKVVNCIIGESKVPIQCPVEFTVDEWVNVVTPKKFNQNHLINGTTVGQQYVILGAGNTSMDTIVYLQTQMKISPDIIRWMIHDDVCMVIHGTSTGGPWS